MLIPGSLVTLSLLLLTTAIGLCALLLKASFYFKGDNQKQAGELQEKSIKIKKLKNEVKALTEKLKSADGETPDKNLAKNNDTQTTGNPSFQAEIDKLKLQAQTQQNRIHELQNALANASVEEQASLIDQLNTEVGRQLQFLKESETCIIQLEQELEKSQSESLELQKNLDDQQQNQSHMENTLEALADKSQAMLQHLANLEQENAYIRTELNKMQP